MMTGVDGSGFGSNSFYSLFKISVYLTNNGMNHIKEVILPTVFCSN